MVEDLLRALPYPQPERLVEIANTYLPQIPRAGLSPGDYADYQTTERGDQRNDGPRFWPQGNALGKRINLRSLDPKPRWNTIVGVYDPVTFVGVAALLIAVALMAAYVPARRACVWTPLWLSVTKERRILRSFGCFPRAS